MNKLGVLTAMYGILRNYKGIPFWFFTPMRRCVRKLAQIILPSYLDKPVKTEGSVIKGLIVSFTSFPARINDVWQVVECILRQSKRPEKIILWLSKDQFESIDYLPESLKKRQSNYFEIRLVDGDLRSHKKYYYAFKEFSDNLVLLIDDDIYYSPDMIENLYSNYIQLSEKCVVCCYGSEIIYENNKRKPYREWSDLNYKLKNPNFFFGSGGGTLLRPSDLYVDVTNEKLFMNLTPLADDVWLNAMCRLVNLPVYHISNKVLLSIAIKNNITLSSINVGVDKNDEQLNNVDNYYYRTLGVRPFDCE